MLFYVLHKISKSKWTIECLYLYICMYIYYVCVYDNTISIIHLRLCTFKIVYLLTLYISLYVKDIDAEEECIHGIIEVEQV